MFFYESDNSVVEESVIGTTHQIFGLLTDTFTAKYWSKVQIFAKQVLKLNLKRKLTCV